MNHTLPDTITLPLKDYVDDLLGSLEHGIDKKSVKQSTALVVAEKDKTERLVHVQFNDLQTDEPLTRPVIWRINDWKSHFLKHERDKAESAKRRREANLRDENTERLIKAMMKATGLQDKELFRGLARKIAVAKNVEGAKKFKTDIET
jgi:hypothetical protein